MIITKNMAEIKPGDFVTIDGQDTIGEVLSVRGNNVEVALGVMKVNVKLNKVTLTKPPEAEKQTAAKDSPYLVDTKERMMHFQFELDLRGKMKEEVMVELLTWVDDALLLGVEEARILHGRGTGVIKNTVRSMLRKYKEVGSMNDETKERGGEGVTVVKFKTS
jgi:DNA mismatch repair protein MutS2